MCIALQSIERAAKTRCGYATIHKVHQYDTEDRLVSRMGNDLAVGWKKKLEMIDR